MKMYDIITKKKLGKELSREEIREFIFKYTAGEIPDYQVSSLLMAIYFKGMTEAETVALTEAITDSGMRLDLSRFGNLTADKHSSGGVGDKTTLIVAPVVAAAGSKVAKMTGRGLGHTGGTADKLESIPGFKTSLSTEEFITQVEKIGISVVAQNISLAPADKKLYALRDVTATVDSIPLIVSSIMGKKLASGSKNITLDVKYGTGSFMKSAEDAEVLATKMVEIGNACGRNTCAIITSMEEPLGYAVGNSLEVIEAINTLRGAGPEDLYEVCLQLSSNMIQSSLGLQDKEAKAAVKEVIASGKAFEKFCEWISAQGGDISYVNDPTKFKRAKYIVPIYSLSDGYISEINSESVGLAALALGAGRITKDDKVDPDAGVILCKKVGSFVKKGDTLAYLHTNNKSALSEAENKFISAIKFSDDMPEKRPLIYKIIR